MMLFQLLVWILYLSPASFSQAKSFFHQYEYDNSPSSSLRVLNDDKSNDERELNFECPQQMGLPLGDINLLIVTDVHGWIAAQHARHEPDVNVDMGDLVSLYRRLQQCAPEEDFFLVFNGDFMDGTGLSTVPPEHLGPLLQKVPFSLLNVGNHELYFNEVVDYMMKDQGFIDHWQGSYLASNVDYIVQEDHSVVPLGDRYTYLSGSNRNSTVLAFGFLYNFDGHCSHTKVRHVEETLEEDWFVEALTQPERDYDAIIIMAHMDATDALVYKILEGIRFHVGDTMPIQFVTGHSHKRKYAILDELATSLEAGKFMDTIGFASFPTQTTAMEIMKQMKNEDNNGDNTENATTIGFQHVLLDANQEALATEALNIDANQGFATSEGTALSVETKRVETRMGLLNTVTNCAPQMFYPLNKPINDSNSLWSLYTEEIIPATLFPALKEDYNRQNDNRPEATPIFIQETGALRYSLYGPTVVLDDIIAVTPFENPVYQVGWNLAARELESVFEELEVDVWHSKWEDRDVWMPTFAVAGDRPTASDDGSHNEDNDEGKLYDLYTERFNKDRVYQAVKSVLGGDSRQFEPRPIYTTIHKQRRPLGTTWMWTEFILKEWRCPEAPEKKKSEDARESHLLLMLAPTNIQYRQFGNPPIPLELLMAAAAFLVSIYTLAIHWQRNQSAIIIPHMELQKQDSPASIASNNSVESEVTPLLLMNSQQNNHSLAASLPIIYCRET